MQQETDNATGDLFEIFGEVISGYTRAQAIEDGVLVDLMQGDMGNVARDFYKFPIACTPTVFDIMRRAVENKRYANSYDGILVDMLWMSQRRHRKLDESTVLFQVVITGAGPLPTSQASYSFKLVVGPGDAGEPVITIMLPNED